MSRVIAVSTKVLALTPVNLNIVFSVKIISCSLKIARPVIVSPTRILPAPSPASKLVSKKGAVKDSTS